MNRHEPTIVEENHETKRLAAAVQWWRLHIAGLTVVELAALTGYSAGAIYRFERGYNSLGKPHRSPAWRRYMRALEAVAKQRGIKGP